MEPFVYEEKSYYCSFEFALDLVSGKWKGLALWHLLGGTMRYGELQKALPNITQKMLTQTLRDLEKSGLVHREVYPVVPPKVEYSLTEDGKKIEPILRLLQAFGDEMSEKLGIQRPACDFKRAAAQP